MSTQNLITVSSSALSTPSRVALFPPAATTYPALGFGLAIPSDSFGNRFQDRHDRRVM